MPVPLQDLAISVYGFRLRNARYGKDAEKHRQELEYFYSVSSAEQEQLQNGMLRRILKTAFDTVPYYQSLRLKSQVDLSTITAKSISTILPVLDRSVLRATNGEFFSTQFEKREYREIGTSGTSGSPLKVRVSLDALKHNYAHFYRFLGQAGVSPFDRSVTFAGRTILGRGRPNNVFWRKNYAMNDLLCSSYHISRGTAKLYLDAMGRWDPQFIDSYPSAIYELALSAQREGITHTVRPKCIITSSETLYGHQRAVIEECFKCKVYDHYGNAEMGAWLTEDSDGIYQANPTYSIVEVIRDDGMPAQPGEVGELVCTNLFNHAMPLIRYKVGDRVRLASNSIVDDGGPVRPRIEQIEGRSDDTIVLRDGTNVGRLDPVFKGVSGIIETQIIQKTHEYFLVKYVPDSNFKPSELEKIFEELQLRLGKDAKIEFNEVVEIEKTSSGKLRAVISELCS
tara:strand:+ start:4864 stop:6225 length:1362 start_codon:yes stop_codon:yes gene_type:complete